MNILDIQEKLVIGITAAVCLLVTIIWIIVRCFCCCKYNTKKQVTLTAPTGKVLADAGFGMGVQATALSYIIGFCLSFYFTYNLHRFLNGQKYSLKDLEITNITVFAFYSTVLDPIVHQSDKPSSLVSSNFDKVQQTFQLRVQPYLGNNIEFIKVFVQVRASQFGSVSDILEYDFDTTTNLDFTSEQVISSIGNANNSAAPLVKFFDVDVNLFKAKYFTESQGCFTEISSRFTNTTGTTDFNLQMTIKSEPGLMVLSQMQLLIIIIIFVVFFLNLYVLIYQCMQHQSLAILFLRPFSEQELIEADTQQIYQ